MQPGLPKRTKDVCSEGKLLLLGQCDLPEPAKKVLRLGPKHGFAPALDPAEKVAMARTVARTVRDDEKVRCVSECLDVCVKSGKYQAVRILLLMS